MYTTDECGRMKTRTMERQKANENGIGKVTEFHPHSSSSLSLSATYIYIYLTKSIKWFTYIVSAFFVIDYIFSRHFPTAHGRGAPRHQKKWTLRHENLLAITSWQQQHGTNYFDILPLSMSSSNIKSEHAATTNVKLTHSGDQNSSLRSCLTSNNTSCNNIIMIQSVLQ